MSRPQPDAASPSCLADDVEWGVLGILPLFWLLFWMACKSGGW